MSDDMRWARFVVSYPLLADALRMPEGTTILHVEPGAPYGAALKDGCTILVQHRDLKPVEDGIVPLIVPEIGQERPIYKDGTVEQDAYRVTWDWNQE